MLGDTSGGGGPWDPQLTSPVPAEQDWGLSSFVVQAQGLTVPGEGTAPAPRVLQPPRAGGKLGTGGLELDVTTGPGSPKVPAKARGWWPAEGLPGRAA